ncbi:unnamed protein product [Camellia sinensis]
MQSHVAWGDGPTPLYKRTNPSTCYNTFFPKEKQSREPDRALRPPRQSRQYCGRHVHLALEKGLHNIVCFGEVGAELRWPHGSLSPRGKMRCNRLRGQYTYKASSESGVH